MARNFDAVTFDLNTITREELSMLEGITPSLAQAVVDHRNANGPFRSWDEFRRLEEVDDAVMEAVRGKLTIGGRG